MISLFEELQVLAYYIMKGKGSKTPVSEAERGVAVRWTATPLFIVIESLNILPKDVMIKTQNKSRKDCKPCQ